MRQKLLVVCVFVLLSLPLLTASVMAQEDLPTLGDLEPGVWTQLSPGGETICSNGTPYSFFVRPAETESDKLLIHFQGGGACWFGEICDLETMPQYDPFVDESDNPTGYGGIFDFANEENPFTDYNMVMVSYCTGDVHIGNATTTYEFGTPAKEVTINHNGYNNATTALDWTFGNFEAPETVFVTGCSAGAIPSPFYTEFVAEAYPDARIEQFGDAAGGYRNPEVGELVFEPWGTMSILTDAYEGITIDELTFEHFYYIAGELLPEVSFSQFNASADEVQAGFLQLTGQSAPFTEMLAANMEQIETTIDNFDSYTAWGSGHCTTVEDSFYSYQVNGTRLRDWVAAIAEGEDVDDVACTDCETEELYEGS